MTRKRSKTPPLRRSMSLLRRRVAKLERFQRRVEGKRRIGFEIDVRGDRIEQDDLDEDFTPDEVP